MNKKQTECIAILALAVFLVGMFIYQVAYATNESSYKWGFKTAFDAYNCVQTEGCELRKHDINIV